MFSLFSKIFKISQSFQFHCLCLTTMDQNGQKLSLQLYLGVFHKLIFFVLIGKEWILYLYISNKSSQELAIQFVSAWKICFFNCSFTLEGLPDKTKSITFEIIVSIFENYPFSLDVTGSWISYLMNTLFLLKSKCPFHSKENDWKSWHLNFRKPFGIWDCNYMQTIKQPSIVCVKLPYLESLLVLITVQEVAYGQYITKNVSHTNIGEIY